MQRFDQRKNRRGEGVALYLSVRIKCSRREDLQEDFEVLWIHVQQKNSKYLFGCAYRAPDESHEIFDNVDVMGHATRNSLEVIT